MAKRDQQLIDRARELCAIQGADSIRRYLGTAAALTFDNALAYRVAFEDAQTLLAQLADLVERLMNTETGLEGTTHDV